MNGPPRPGRRLRLIARKLPGAMNVNTAATDGIDSLVAAFDLTYEKFVAAGVLMKPDRDECRRSTRRSSYEGRVRRIATLMLFDEPWVFPQASRQSNLKTHCGIHSKRGIQLAVIEFLKTSCELSVVVMTIADLLQLCRLPL